MTAKPIPHGLQQHPFTGVYRDLSIDRYGWQCTYCHSQLPPVFPLDSATRLLKKHTSTRAHAWVAQGGHRSL